MRGFVGVLIGTVRNVVNVAKEVERLRKQVLSLQRDLILMQRSRDYWAAYQRQTAMEAGKAQEFMVSKIDDLRRKLGVDDGVSWLEHVRTWEERRIKSEGSHPFSPTFEDLGKDVTPSVTPESFATLPPHK